jgi:outer membrane lipoprotein-sorting protein
MKNMFMVISMAGLLIGLFGCSQSSDKNEFLPEQVLTNALEEYEKPFAYYGEAEMTMYENENKLETVYLKEWVSEDGKRRVESMEGENINIATFDGEKFISYNPNEKTAYIIEDKSLLSLNEISPKEQAERMLKAIRNTHEFSQGKGEKVAGRDTYHLVAKTKNKNSLLGDIDVWVDKENWLVLKMISHSADVKVEMEYTKIDLNIEIPKDKFVLDLPSDVEIQDMNELNETSEITLEEAAEALEQDFLYIPEKDGLTISNIERYDLKGEVNRVEINLNYEKDHLPYFFISVFKTGEELEIFPGEEEVTVRNQRASYMNLENFQSLTWQENGLNYSVVLLDPQLSLEKFQSLAEEMVSFNVD